ncbi:sulfite exporter TauE/SafE family protein [Comamonas antarctica]|uniref:Probable membrane transporter protein n=1 Tax=Comamonas antarctica TaxID=2743470 RepID=A0A6N1X1C9_9BURK|nr:sulfite exporter TauE/SafE family protein [Comamonas antarctica]QKV52738.1 sulfite exporter TauE/SafE family protein [Comamonas antarctica]
MPEFLTFSDAGVPLLITLVFVLAGVVKGVVGLGLPTIAMALLALMMAPAHAAALLIVPSLVTNIWQLSPWAGLNSLLRRLAPMQLGICAGTLAGAWLLGAPAGAWASVCLGVALVAYAAWGLAGARLAVSPASERWLGPLIGASTGLVTAATGVFVLPAVPYLQALGLQRDALVQAMGLSFTVSTLALAAGLYANAQFSGASLGASALLLLPALAGMAAGQYLRRKLSPVLFRQVFLISLALLGSHMLAKPLLAP